MGNKAEREEIIEYLMDKNVCDNGSTPLLHCLCQYAFKIDLIKRLCEEHPEYINFKDEKGDSPIMKCASSSARDGVKKEEKEQIIEYLVGKGAETKYESKDLKEICNEEGLDISF